MLKRYYRTLRGETMTEVSENRSGMWVHLENPTKHEVAEVVELYGLTPGHLEDALDEDEAPRLEIEGEQIYFYVRFALRDVNGDFDTIPLLIIMLENNIITVSSRHVVALEPLIAGQYDVATTQKIKLFLLILQRLTDQYDALIDKTSRNIKQVRQRLRTEAVTNQDLMRFATIEDELNEFLSSLQPNNAALRRLLIGHHLKLFDEDQDLVEDVLLTNEQSIEKCNGNIRSIIGVRNAHSSISDNSLNQTMKILTIATLCIAIPNMFFGMYGMNVTTPFQNQHWAYIFVMAITLAITFAVYWYGRKKGVF